MTLPQAPTRDGHPPLTAAPLRPSQDALRGTRSALLLLGALALSLFACSGGPDEMRPERRAGRGESCTTTNECSSGLICVRNACVLGDYPIAPDARVCGIVQCETDIQCALSAEQQCPDDAAACEAGDFAACSRLEEAPCQRTYRCEDRLCVAAQAACTEDEDCPFSRPICVAGQCVQCLTQDNCETGFLCSGNVCVPSCQTTMDCPYFHACQSNRCVEVGCATDRECVAFTGRVFARCSDKQCLLPCDTDRDCSSEDSFDYEVCRDGRCVYVGCQTEEECRIALGDQLQTPSLHQRRVTCEPARR